MANPSKKKKQISMTFFAKPSAAIKFAPSTQLARLECLYCDKWFSTPQGLSSHNKIHAADPFCRIKKKPKYGKVKIRDAAGTVSPTPGAAAVMPNSSTDGTTPSAASVVPNSSTGSTTPSAASVVLNSSTGGTTPSTVSVVPNSTTEGVAASATATNSSVATATNSSVPSDVDDCVNCEIGPIIDAASPTIGASAEEAIVVDDTIAGDGAFEVDDAIAADDVVDDSPVSGRNIAFKNSDVIYLTSRPK